MERDVRKRNWIIEQSRFRRALCVALFLVVNTSPICSTIILFTMVFSCVTDCNFNIVRCPCNGLCLVKCHLNLHIDILHYITLPQLASYGRSMRWVVVKKLVCWPVDDVALYPTLHGCGADCSNRSFNAIITAQNKLLPGAIWSVRRRSYDVISFVITTA